MTQAPTPPTLLRAAWVAPIDRPPIPHGAVLIDAGKIVLCETLEKTRRFAPPHAVVRDLGDAVILPGLVNAHTHLELSHLTPPPNPGRFIDWLAAVMSTAGDETRTAASVAAGAAQSVHFGVTTVGDITRHPAAARPALRASSIRAVSFGEVVGIARRKFLLPQRIAAAVENTAPTPHLYASLSPHAPYSIAPEGYLQCISTALSTTPDRPLPLTTHLAETPDEATFLSHHAGPFRELLERLGAWADNPFPPFPDGPVAYAKSLGLLDYSPCALAHVNYCTDADLSLLAAGRASVVYCPRTHAYFNHPPHRWRDMLAAGVNVAVGTDSLASSPNLNLADDLRLLHRLAPEVPPHTLWEMATLNAARALGLASVAGSLTPNKSADLAIFPAPASVSDPLLHLLESPALPTEVWFAGVPVPPSK